MTHAGGKPIKVEAAAPPTFSRIDVDTDIEDWLEQARENCVFGQVDQSQWVVYASGFLGGEPKSQWLARKRESRLPGNTAEVMQWDSFVFWCRKTFAIRTVLRWFIAVCRTSSQLLLLLSTSRGSMC